jgi:hypothetical protein
MQTVHLEGILETYDYIVRHFKRSIPLLNASPLTKQYLGVLPLKINMRLLNLTMDPDERRQQDESANHTLTIGEGRDTINETVQ